MFPRVEAWLADSDPTAEVVPSPELAEASMDRFEALRRGDLGDRLSLSSVEIVSILRYSVPGMIPDGIGHPEVELRDGVVAISASVAFESFPLLPDLDSVLGFLPDTVVVSLEGVFAPLDEKRVALVIHAVQAAFIPLPDRMIPDILMALGREEVEGLAKDALVVPLPDGIVSVHVLRDSLVLVAKH